VARLLIGNSLRKVAARWRWLQHLLWLMEAAFFALFLGVCRVLPADRATAFGRNLLQWIGPRQAKQRIVRRNLQLAFPGRSEQEIESLARAIWGGAGSLLAEYSHVGEICEAAADPRIECVFAGEIPEFHDHSTPKVFVSAHLGNWEFIAAALIRYGVPLTAIYTPMQNPWLERLLALCRRPLGCRLVARDESMRPLIRELNEGRSIGLLMDQRVDSGRPIPMFGIDKWTTLVPARLARAEARLPDHPGPDGASAGRPVSGHDLSPGHGGRSGSEPDRASRANHSENQRPVRGVDPGAAGRLVLHQAPVPEGRRADAAGLIPLAPTIPSRRRWGGPWQIRAI
jgi:KDO2-lipid IV(A) lauroyltransferase